MEIYFIDTSVLIRHPNLFFEVTNTKIIIHNIVIEELSKLSKLKNKKGLNARQAIKNLYKIKNRGCFCKGIKVKTNIVQFSSAKPNLNFLGYGLKERLNDNFLLCIAMKLKEENKNIVLVTYDKTLSLKANDFLDTKCLEKEKQKNIKKYRNHKAHKRK